MIFLCESTQQAGTSKNNTAMTRAAALPMNRCGHMGRGARGVGVRRRARRHVTGRRQPSARARGRARTRGAQLRTASMRTRAPARSAYNFHACSTYIKRAACASLLCTMH